MRYFHRTGAPDAILASGFADGIGTYLTGDFHEGVWLSDRPLDGSEGAKGSALLAVDVPAEIADLFDRRHEWVEEGKPYREWLVPASVLNEHAELTLLEAERERYPDPSVTFAEALVRHRLVESGEDHLRCLDCDAIWQDSGRWWRCPNGCNGPGRGSA